MMNDALKSLVPQQNDAAAAKLAAYGDLRRVEAWRWTQLEAFKPAQYRVQHADYQLDIPDNCEESLEADPEIRDRWLEIADAPFAWLNFSLLEEALTITVPEGAVVDQAIAVNIDAARRALQCSRINVKIGAGAKAAFWFDYRCDGSSAQLPVLTVQVGDEAEAEGVLWLGGEEGGAQLAHVACELGERSVARLNAVMHGASLTRLDVQAVLQGQFADFKFGGLQTLQGQQIGDYHVNVRHLTENGTSQQVVRGALDGNSKGIFDGLIYVAHGAQLTDAQQDSRYMLMSHSATSHSVPRLEIYADDVKCAHGSTVGFLDPEALFYLRSRGVAEAAARKMLTLSFLHEAVVVEHEVLHEPLHDAISALWMEGNHDAESMA